MEQRSLNTKKVPDLVHNKVDLISLPGNNLPDYPLRHLPNHVFSLTSPQPLCQDGDHLSPFARSSRQDN